MMNVKVLVSLCALLAVVWASSHSEAPGTASSRTSDLTDLYVFRCYEPGREDRTCFIMNANPLQNPFGGPNYFTLSDKHFFEIYIDNNGDANEDITFQFFTGNNLNGPINDVPFVLDDQDCNVYSRAVAPRPLTTQKHTGLEINVGGTMVRVALKFLGPITQVYDPNLNWFEYYHLNVIRGDRTFGTREQVYLAGNTSATQFPKPFDYAGTKTFSDYDTYARAHISEVEIPGCTGGSARVFVGQRREAFNIALGAIFDLINFVPIPGFPGAVEDDPSHNDLATLNVDSFVLEVPTSCLTAPNQGGVIGAWAGVRQLRHSADDDHVPGAQTNRLGNPLVNELVIGIIDKSVFNKQEPRMDATFLTYVTNPTLPTIISLLFLDAVNGQRAANNQEPLETLAPTNYPRTDLVAIFLTGLAGVNQPLNVTPAEMIRLNTTIPATASADQNPIGLLAGDAAGYPNGRRPGDDVTDISLRAIMGAVCHAGLGICEPEDAPVGNVAFLDGAPLSSADVDAFFPYLRTPLPGSTGI